MAIPTRVIKRRIKSIRSTGKIMKAMELVAASKMRKATQLTLATRPYSKSIQELSTRVRQLVDPTRHPLLSGLMPSPYEGGGRGEVQPVGRTRPAGGQARGPAPTLLIIAASDRGLCGGFNNQLMKKALEFLGTRQEDVKLALVGRRAEQTARHSRRQVSASFEAISNAPSFERALPVAQFALKEFLDGNVSRVFMCYTDFKSALNQIPNVIQLLPVIPEKEFVGAPLGLELVAERQFIAPSVSVAETDDGEGVMNHAPTSDLFEPDPDAVLNSLLPRLLEMQIYQALLESSASEHSARMMAMRSAGDAASEMLDDLTFTLNQARQAAITREISEISAGKAAIE